MNRLYVFTHANPHDYMYTILVCVCCVCFDEQQIQEAMEASLDAHALQPPEEEAKSASRLQPVHIEEVSSPITARMIEKEKTVRDLF